MLNNKKTRNLFLALLFTAKSIPAAFFLMGLPVILRLEGHSLVSIGMFQLASLPYLFKFLWAPLLDKNSHRKNHYKSWILITGIGVGAGMILLGFVPPKNYLKILFAFIMAISIVTATMDIAISSLYIKLFSFEERGIGSTGKIFAVNLATIFSSGILIMVYNHAGWIALTSLSGISILVSLLCLSFLQEPENQIDSLKNQVIGWSGLLNFFIRPGMLKWIILLVCKSSSITAVFFIIRPFLVDQGYEPDAIAFLTGIFAVAAGAVATLVTAMEKVQHLILNRRISLISCVIFNALAGALFVPVFFWGSRGWMIYVAVGIINASLSFVSVVSGTLIMDFSKPGSEGVDYSLQMTAIHGGGLGMAAISGVMAESMGYGNFFIFHAVLGCLLILFTSLMFRGKWVPTS